MNGVYGVGRTYLGRIGGALAGLGAARAAALSLAGGVAAVEWVAVDVVAGEELALVLVAEDGQHDHCREREAV